MKAFISPPIHVTIRDEVQTYDRSIGLLELEHLMPGRVVDEGLLAGLKSRLVDRHGDPIPEHVLRRLDLEKGLRAAAREAFTFPRRLATGSSKGDRP